MRMGHGLSGLCDQGRRKASYVKTQVQTTPSASKNAEWKILVVDDEASCGDLFAGILADDGYSVRTATSGVDALKQLRESPADLVLTDMVMPQMNGMQLLAQIKELYPETDVIVMTGYGTIEESLEAMRRGAADFLPKPFQPHELSRLTMSCLRAKRANCDKAFLRQSNSMLELARLLSRTNDIHVLPARALEMACENFDADSAILLAYEPAHETLSVLAHAGGELTRWGHSSELSRQGIEAVRQQTIVLSAEPRNGDCYAFAPLLVGDHPRGVLCLRRSGGPWFHEKTSELIEIFATHLALAIDSSQLYETASQQVCDLEELITVSRSLSLKRNPGDICQQVLKGAHRLTHAEICAVLLLNDGQPIFETLPPLPEGSPIHDAVRIKLLAALNPLSSRQNELHCATPRSPLSGEIRHKLTSFINAPMTVDETRIGIVGAFSSERDRFSLEDALRISSLADNAAAAMENAATIARMAAMYHETIEMLSQAGDRRDTFSSGHSNQVRIYAGELARALRLSDREVYRIEDGALLHDIGKICVPQALLLKPRPLSHKEFEIVVAHPIYGAKLFSNAPHLQDLVPMVRNHHENYDGTGYPDQLQGEDIPIGARIVALADVFDALISHRPYRAATDHEAARQMIALKAGTQFDPELSRLFLSLPLEDLIEH